MNNRTNLRKLRNLIYKFSADVQFYDPRWLNHKDPAFCTQFFETARMYQDFIKYKWSSPSKWMITRKELWDLYCEMNLTPEQLYEIAVDVISIRESNRVQLNGRPPRSRKDNGQQKVGSGGSNRNKVRFPKKCRKTAWKRFYKLFPHTSHCH